MCNLSQIGANTAANGGAITYAPLASFLCIAFLVAWHRALPRILPGRWAVAANAGPLALLILTGGLAYANPALFASAGVALVGKLANGVPTLAFPTYAPPSATDVSNLLAAAFPCAFVGYMESLCVAVVIA